MVLNLREVVTAAGYDENIEIVHLHNVPFFKYNKKMLSIESCPKDITKYFVDKYQDEVSDSPEMIIAYKQMGLSSEEYFTQWLICNFGGEDSTPDFSLETKKFHKEYWNCGIKDICPGFGIGCRKDLTPRQFEILKLFREGLPDKLIADKLKITENTIREHRRNIFEKLNSNNKQEAIRFAECDSIILE
jgi:DNA-binding CsgD family transcriptional regulator